MKRILVSLFVILVSFSIYAESIFDRLLSLGLEVAKKPLKPVEFELESLNGEFEKLTSFKGRVVFLNFWATWCGPCRIEMPSMERLYKTLKNEGLEIVAVNSRESKRQVQRFVDEYKLTFPVLLDETGQVGAAYGARFIPITYLLDRNGNIFARAMGAKEWDTLEILAVFREILKNGMVYQEES